VPYPPKVIIDHRNAREKIHELNQKGIIPRIQRLILKQSASWTHTV